MRTLLVVMAVFAFVGCKGPSEEKCKEAVKKLRTLHGQTDDRTAKESIEGQVRRCKTGATKEVVSCILKPGVKTVADLDKCPGFAELTGSTSK